MTGIQALEMGYKYSNLAYVRQLCMHGVGGYVVYYFSFQLNKHVPSLVDAKA
jgi:hypothetical protein